MDGNDDNMLWYENEEDGGVRSECEEDERTDREDVNSDSVW